MGGRAAYRTVSYGTMKRFTALFLVYTSYCIVVFITSQHRNNRIVADKMVKKVKGIAVIIKKLRVAVLLQILVVKKISAAAAKTGVVALAFAHPEDELRQETRLAVERKDGQRMLSRRRMDIFER